MASPRTRRLMADAERIRRRFSGWPVVEISGTAGIPPEIYRFTYHLKGLYIGPGGAILERDTHLLEVNLSLDYPRRAPQCRMLTPVFHPNFDDASVCIGDFWAASEGLDDLILRIGRMIAYQEYNTRSPLNGLAAKWAAQNPGLLPVDPRPVAPPDGGLGQELPSDAVIAGAGAQSPPAVMPEPAPVQEPAGIVDPWSEKIVIEA